jgi:hypothetical protein
VRTFGGIGKVCSAECLLGHGRAAFFQGASLFSGGVTARNGSRRVTVASFESPPVVAAVPSLDARDRHSNLHRAHVPDERKRAHDPPPMTAPYIPWPRGGSLSCPIPGLYVTRSRTHITVFIAGPNPPCRQEIGARAATLSARIASLDSYCNTWGASSCENKKCDSSFQAGVCDFAIIRQHI